MSACLARSAAAVSFAGILIAIGTLPADAGSAGITRVRTRTNSPAGAHASTSSLAQMSPPAPVLNRPAVGIAATPDAKGYWEVAADGGIFAFGDARFYGSTAFVHLARPMVAMAQTSAGGYWLVNSIGQVFTFGAATFQGSASPSVIQMGDSISATLGIDLATAGIPAGVQYYDEGILGCGIAQGEPVIANGYNLPEISPYCNGKSGTQWEQVYASDVNMHAPQVAVLLVGYWEIADRYWNGGWANITQPAYASYLRHQLEVAITILHSAGAHVVLLTCPYFDQPDPGTLVPVPEASNARVDAWNAIIHQMPRLFGPAVSVADLNAQVDPSGKFASSIDGIAARAPDGEHFPFFNFRHPGFPEPDTITQAAQFGSWIGRWFWQRVVG